MREFASIIAVIRDIRFGMLALLVSVVGGFHLVSFGYREHEERIPFVNEGALRGNVPSYGSNGFVDNCTNVPDRKTNLKNKIRLSKQANPRNFIGLVSDPTICSSKPDRD